MSDQKIRVLVVDDSTFMRGALVRMIERDSRFTVIGTAVNGQEGVQKAQELKPDVVTMDVEMPVMNGIEALREIMATVKVPVVMLSTLTEAGASVTMQALELGAVDFIPKALQDKDKNIFRGAELIHEKLLAAAGARVAPIVAETVPAVRSVAAASVARVNARAVVVGSSTGGPRALQIFLQQLPERFGLPILVAQHMPPSFTKALANRLNETCAVSVVEATEGAALMPGTVYIAPGGVHMRVGADNRLHMAEDVGESPYKPSVDVLAESVLSVFGGQAVGVMLTGMGNDGARAFLALRKAGAYILAQDQGSSVVYGMPKVVAENGAANEVVSVTEMGHRLATLAG